jgi:hypothetical protein
MQIIRDILIGGIFTLVVLSCNSPAQKNESKAGESERSVNVCCASPASARHGNTGTPGSSIAQECNSDTLKTPLPRLKIWF